MFEVKAPSRIEDINELALNEFLNNVPFIDGEASSSHAV